ncbi:ABC transporter permease [Magnetospira sp. QH-2]|uniref:ABC transporter permease n=1 Tax=Magnetospira sp. (strain QH-2) TaxID=1288970 RepID=UPI0003E8106F|nr:ABC transporter permease subunit [Magnetospira sp. QH-2]CCQ73144.1 ABC-type transport system involved in multi-copper enzyme maturation, permease component [Magnetospira sp. QH-2]
MKALFLTMRLDMAESVRARWFLIYTIVFGGLVVGLMVFGLTESRVMGVTGLSRMLVTFIQISLAILPIFILLSTVRSLAGDREAGVFEYMLSLPVSLSSWYWGKFAGRFAVVFLPVFLAMAVAVIWGMVTGLEVPWGHFAYYVGLLFSMAFCFLGIGFLLSSMARGTDIGQGMAFIVWLVMLLFLDLILLGMIIRTKVPMEFIVGIALANPLQSFRTAAMMLFDPQLILLGPSAYVILDAFGRGGYMVYAAFYPVAFGAMCGGIGYWLFRRGDLP